MENNTNAIVRTGQKMYLCTCDALVKVLSSKTGRSILTAMVTADMCAVRAFAESSDATGTANEVLSTITSLLGPGVIVVGSLVALVGGVNLGTSFARQDGASKTEGIMTLVGGAIIGAVGAVISNTELSFGS